MVGMIHPTNPHIDKSDDAPKNCSAARQLSKFRRLVVGEKFAFSTTYNWSANCLLTLPRVISTRDSDADDHEKGKRRSGL
jgi:hypothetical protein